MKFQIISDIHIERAYPEVPRLESIIKPLTDTLILAGDIGHLEYMHQYVMFLHQVEVFYKRAILILGNHEPASKRVKVSVLINQLKEHLREMPTITLLEEETIDLDITFRVFGSTMWTSIPRASWGLQSQYWILDGDEKHDSHWINKQHSYCLERLDEEILRAQGDGKQLIVIGHHAPLLKGPLDNRYDNDPKRFYYATDLSRYLVRNKVAVWVFGHTHVNCDLLTDGHTRVVSNQFQGAGYDPEKIIVV